MTGAPSDSAQRVSFRRRLARIRDCDCAGPEEVALREIAHGYTILIVPSASASPARRNRPALDDSIMEVSRQLPGRPVDASGATSEETYVDLLRAGDAEAWARLVEGSGPRLLSYLKYNLPTIEDAEDVLSETFAAAVQSMGTFELRASLTTWLYSLAHRKMVDFWRRNRNTEEIPDTLQSVEHRVSLEFREALARLPVEARQAMILRYACDLSTTEVAVIIGRSYKATESLLSRAREKFRSAYGDEARQK